MRGSCACMERGNSRFLLFFLTWENFLLLYVVGKSRSRTAFLAFSASLPRFFFLQLTDRGFLIIRTIALSNFEHPHNYVLDISAHNKFCERSLGMTSQYTSEIELVYTWWSYLHFVVSLQSTFLQWFWKLNDKTFLLYWAEDRKQHLFCSSQ